MECSNSNFQYVNIMSSPESIDSNNSIKKEENLEVSYSDVSNYSKLNESQNISIPHNNVTNDDESPSNCVGAMTNSINNNNNNAKPKRNRQIKRKMPDDEQQYVALNDSHNNNNDNINNSNNNINNSNKCTLCQSAFSSVNNLKQHVESYHMKSNMWVCTECGKTFSSKSNLKVHLRVHTRIRPYHCKHCAYSCMHHSSIREHLAKVHPEFTHCNSNPGYVYNSNAVPDPEKFNSQSFNREEFIQQAKQDNDKLSAQITSSIQLNTPNSVSPNSNTSIKVESDEEKPKRSTVKRASKRARREAKESDYINENEISKTSSDDTNGFDTQNPFSINSLIGAPVINPFACGQPGEMMGNMNMLNQAAAWFYANQMLMHIMNLQNKSK